MFSYWLLTNRGISSLFHCVGSFLSPCLHQDFTARSEQCALGFLDLLWELICLKKNTGNTPVDFWYVELVLLNMNHVKKKHQAWVKRVRYDRIWNIQINPDSVLKSFLTKQHQNSNKISSVSDLSLHWAVSEITWIPGRSVEEILVVSQDLHWLAGLPQADKGASVSRCQCNVGHSGTTNPRRGMLTWSQDSLQKIICDSKHLNIDGKGNQNEKSINSHMFVHLILFITVPAVTLLEMGRRHFNCLMCLNKLVCQCLKAYAKCL